MEKKEMNDPTSSRRLLPPLYPSSPTTTNVPRAGNSHHQHYSRSRPFQDNPAATAHFVYQAGSGCKAGSFSIQQPSSLLSRMTHASAGVGGSSNTASQDTVSGSGCAAGSSSLLPQIHSSGGVGVSSSVVDGGSYTCIASQVSLPGYSCYQMPTPSSLAPMALDQAPMLGGGRANFFSSPDNGLASVVGLAPRPCTQSPSSWYVDQASSESGLWAPLLTQSTASMDFGLTEDYLH